MMDTIKLLDAIGEINDEAVRGARAEKKPKSREWIKWTSMAAGLCLAFLSIFALSKLRSSAPMDGGADGGYAGAPGGYTPGFDGQASSDGETGEEDPAAQTENDTSPVYYSSLMLADGVLDEEVLAFSESSTMDDIASFDESTLSRDHCCMIIEGTVVNLYVKHYTFDVYGNKFEKNGILHGGMDTIVYEVAVDKTWYGADISGDTILIEDSSYFTESVLAVKEGRRYVLPLYEYGETIPTGIYKYVSGDITRETVYSTIYPYHPQIEVTDDGSYLVSQDWTTLTAKNAREVIMDTLDEENFYYRDKMRLVDEKTFAEQMAVLVDNIQ